MAGPVAAAVERPAPAPRGLLERLRAATIRWLSDPVVRRRLARFPLTRPAARMHARRLFDLSAGFVYSQILLAMVELDVAEALGDQPGEISMLAARLGLPEAELRRLLDGAESIGLVRWAGAGRVALTTLGAALRSNDGLTAMIGHHRVLYRDLEDPVALLRDPSARGELASFWPYAGRADPAALADDAVAPYSRLMARSAGFVIEQVIDVYPFERHSRVLDVGGGEGVFLEAVARRAGSVRDLVVYDLPAVAARAERRLAAAGMGGRVSTQAGDFTRDALPVGFDLITFVRVLHDHDDVTVARLLAAARSALAPGGRVLIAEPFADAPGAARVGRAYFAFYLKAMGRGHCRSPQEYRVALERAGFGEVREWPTSLPLQAGAVSASVPVA